MSCDIPSVNNPMHYPTAHEIGAAADACDGPPPLPPLGGNSSMVSPAADSLAQEVAKTALLRTTSPPIVEPPPQLNPTPIETALQRVAAQPAMLADTVKTTKNAPANSLRSRCGRLLFLGVSRLIYWYREDGFWYISSMMVHAIGLFSVALISLAVPHAISTTLSRDNAPSFDPANVPCEAPIDIARFEVGNAPLEPTELNAETLAQLKALPVGGQTAKYYDDSPFFEEAGGGTVTDLKGPKLGGLGGFSVKDLPGPGGRGGVGVGPGLGKNAGVGGAGEGFGSRGKGHREAMLGAMGGTKASERAVGAALNWLYRHQTSHGKWSIDFRHQCKNGTCSGQGFIKADTAATAMALLPFLAAGQTHKTKGPYQQTVTKGLAWLLKQQKPDGSLAGDYDQPMYPHGLATLALCEAYGMSGDEHIGEAARQAVGFIVRAQNESTGGWRYQPGDPGDTSVFGWQIMALKSGQLAGLPVDSLVFENAQKWLHSVAKGEHLGLYSYQPYREVTPTMTAVGMLCRQYFGIDPKDPAMLEGKQILLQNLPETRLGRNTYYWYYATLAMHNFADADWDRWNRKIRRTLIDTQCKTGCATGSWDPEKPTLDAWGSQGGRLMTTSFSTLILEVYYRYLPLFRTDSLVPKPANQNLPPINAGPES